MNSMISRVSSFCRGALWRLGFAQKPWNDEKQKKWDNAIKAGKLLPMEDAPPGHVLAFVQACFKESERIKRELPYKDLDFKKDIRT